MYDNDDYENENYRPVEYKKSTGEKAKEAGETAAGIGCATLGCLGQTAVSSVFLVIQIFVGLFILGFIARLFGCGG